LWTTAFGIKDARQHTSLYWRLLSCKTCHSWHSIVWYGN